MMKSAVNLDVRTSLELQAMTRALEDGLTYDRQTFWPCQARPFDVKGEGLSLLGWRVAASEDGEVLAETDERDERVLLIILLENGWCYLRTFARVPEVHAAIETRLRKLLPETELMPTQVSATFWMLTAQGPRAISRQLAAPTWAACARCSSTRTMAGT
jgi:hypothetical protein